MTEDRKKAIVSSFSDNFETATINLQLSKTEFEKFEKGVFCNREEDRWNAFVLDGYIYLSRSWTDICIFKLRYQENEHGYILYELKVTRDPLEYTSKDINNDIESLGIMFDFYLGRMCK